MEKRQEARPKEKGISRPRRLNHNEVIPRIEQSQDEVSHLSFFEEAFSDIRSFQVDSPLAVAVARAVQDVMRGKRLLRLLISEDDEEGALQMILEIEKVNIQQHVDCSDPHADMSAMDPRLREGGPRSKPTSELYCTLPRQVHGNFHLYKGLFQTFAMSEIFRLPFPLFSGMGIISLQGSMTEPNC